MNQRPPLPQALAVWRLVALALVALPAGVLAQSLVSVHDLARHYDAAYQAAKAQHEATLARAQQARAGLLPSAGLQAGVNRNHIQAHVGSYPGQNLNYTQQTLGLSAAQPLYRPANTATYEQGKKQAELAQAQLGAAEQDLIVRVSQAYFDVLAAQDTLGFVRAQKAAVAEQLAAAKRNFEVGTSTITDTREAQARHDLVVAHEIAADNDLRIKQAALDQVVGQTGIAPYPLTSPVELPPLLPDSAEAWVAQAEANSSAIAQAELAVQLAGLEIEKARAGHKPTVDLTASYGLSRYPGGNPAAATALAQTQTNRTHASAIGLVLNLPLFTGFATDNRVRETYALQDKARADLQAARRGIVQATRSAFLGLQAGRGQVAALEAARLSSQSALEANQLGYQVGVRINIDVLNSQTQLYQTLRDLSKARYEVLMGGLKLRQAAGVLKPQDLEPINALLKPGAAETSPGPGH